MSAPGLVVSAPASGGGKTLLTLALLRAFRAKGLRVAPFKNGPDYIDPAFHSAACGEPSYNLDTWAMDIKTLARLTGTARGADIILAEGSMGLFDGVTQKGAAGTGASADLAAMTGWPVLLALDVSGQAQSAGAAALGCARFRKNVAIAGVVLNKVASPRHEVLARAGLEEAGIRVFGAIPRRTELALPSRHLGLVQAGELPELEKFLDEAAATAAQHLDLDAIASAARQGRIEAPQGLGLAPPGQKIALARDEAFSFLYPHLLKEWRAAGAELLFFSPLADEPPDPSADVCWLPGGYPELHAGKITAAQRFKSGLRHFAQTRPVHGECGGYMVLGASLIDAQGISHEMAGLLGLVSSFAQRKLHLGYRLARLSAPMASYRAGAVLRGHEFHYASILAQPDEILAEVRDAQSALVAETGSRREKVSGTFFHLIAPDESAGAMR